MGGSGCLDVVPLAWLPGWFERALEISLAGRVGLLRPSSVWFPPL